MSDLLPLFFAINTLYKPNDQPDDHEQACDYLFDLLPRIAGRSDPSTPPDQLDATDIALYRMGLFMWEIMPDEVKQKRPGAITTRQYWHARLQRPFSAPKGKPFGIKEVMEFLGLCVNIWKDTEVKKPLVPAKEGERILPEEQAAMHLGLRYFRYYIFIARLAWRAAEGATPLQGLVEHNHPAVLELQTLLDSNNQRAQTADCRMRCRSIHLSQFTPLAARSTFHMDRPTNHVAPQYTQLVDKATCSKVINDVYLEPDKDWELLDELLRDAWRLAWFAELIDSGSQKEVNFMQDYVILFNQWDAGHVNELLDERTKRELPALPRIIALGPDGGWAVTGFVKGSRRWHWFASLVNALAAWVQWVIAFHEGKLETYETLTMQLRPVAKLMKMIIAA
jgi:hypothetical protein